MRWEDVVWDWVWERSGRADFVVREWMCVSIS